MTGSSGGSVIDASAFLSDSAPLAEAGTPNPGMMRVAPRADHAHPRLTATFTGTTDANGLATILPFTRTFTKSPALVITAVENTTDDAPRFKVQRWLKQDGSTWSNAADGLVYGCVLYASRSRALPAIAQLSTGIALLGTLITGLNTIFSSLSGFLPVQAASSVAFTGLALTPSQ